MTIMVVHGIFLVLVLWIVPSTCLICYTCVCPASNPSVCNCSDTINVAEGAHCIISKDFDTSIPSVELSSTLLNSSYSRITDPYYIIVDESIFYNETTALWETKTKGVVYGCDWDYCNNFTLISSLPNTFALIIGSPWLQENIYGNGSVSSCNSCSNGICGNGTYPIDPNLCPFTLCDNLTTCSLRNLWQDVQTNELCYQSECTTPQSADASDEKYKVQVEAIVYLAQNRSNIGIWKLDINCAGENCSRLTIFQEIQQRIQVEVGDLTAFPSDRPTTSLDQLSCYNCYCIDESDCACNETVSLPVGESYCTIVRLYRDGHVFLILEHINQNSSAIQIRDYPFILVDESILYNETTSQWYTNPTLVLFGCDTNNCNVPRLVQYLPITFEMRLPETWLNSNILSTGQPTRDCHECPDAPVCSIGDFLDTGRCPIRTCNTTCYVADTFDNPEEDFYCYQSYCLSEDSDEDKLSGHRVEIEGIIYGNQPNATLEFWGIEIYCRADDCSRPEIFQELEAQLEVDIGDLSEFFNTTVIITPASTVPTTAVPTTTATTIPPGQTITCYDCFCYDDPNCPCDTFTVVNASSSYCIIIRQNIDADFYVTLRPIARNATQVYIREFPYLFAEESILYNETTGRWYTRNNIGMFGCNTNYCNHPSLVSHLPDSFRMTLPELWLNSSILGTGQPVSSCHECPGLPVCSTTGFLDEDLCPIQSCNTTCVVTDLFDIPDSNEQCYESFCAPPDSDFYTVDPHRVELEGILYLYPVGRLVELWEIDIFCRVYDCSRPTIFDEIRAELSTEVGDISIFYSNITTTTSVTTVGTSSTTTTMGGVSSTSSGTGSTASSSSSTSQSGSTTTPTTTTTSAGPSNYMSQIILIFSMCLFNLY